MRSVSQVLSEVGICIAKYKLNAEQVQDFIRQVAQYEENSDPFMRLDTKSDDSLVDNAFMDYMNHQTGYRIGEHQS